MARKEMLHLLRRSLSKLKNSLDHRERTILEQRIVASEPLTLQALGAQFGVSRERIRQVEHTIIRKVKTLFSDELPDYQAYLAS